MLLPDRAAPVIIGTSEGRFIIKTWFIGGSGLIGSKLVATLGEHGHEAVGALTDASKSSPM